MCAPLLRKILSSWGPPWFFGTTLCCPFKSCRKACFVVAPPDMRMCSVSSRPVIPSNSLLFGAFPQDTRPELSTPKWVLFSEGVTGGSKVLHHPARLRSEGRHAARDWAATLAVEGRSRPGEPAKYVFVDFLFRFPLNHPLFHTMNHQHRKEFKLLTCIWASMSTFAVARWDASCFGKAPL